MNQTIAPAPSGTLSPQRGVGKVLAMVACLAIMATLLPASVEATSRDRARTQAEVDFVARVNAIRDDAGRAGLVWDDRIAAGARAHVDLMVDGGRAFSASNLALEIRGAVTDWTEASEVVGSGTDADTVLSAVLADEQRRAVLLGDYNRAGLGLVTADGQTYVVLRVVKGAALEGFTPYSADGGYTAEVRRLYLAFFGREPDSGGAAFWRAKRTIGMPLAEIASHFSRSAEFRVRYGAVSDAEFVALVYRNVLSREPDVRGREYWRARLGDGMTRGRLMAHFSESAEFRSTTTGPGRGQPVATPGTTTVSNPGPGAGAGGGGGGASSGSSTAATSTTTSTTTTTPRSSTTATAPASSSSPTTSSTASTSTTTSTTAPAPSGAAVGDSSVSSGVRVGEWLTAAGDRGDPGYPAFRTFCQFSHLGFYDPIVEPNNPSFMHLHMFYGNTQANHQSTYQSLRSGGGGTCDGGPLNRTAYWTPAVFDAQHRVVVPNRPYDYNVELYYKAENARVVNGRSVVQSYPNGLRMIAGHRFDGLPVDPSAVIPGGATLTWGWKCDGGRSTGTIPDCPAGSRLTSWVRFPYCWNGRDLDSADHRSHLRYGTGNTWGECPSSHPVHLPELTQLVHYDIAAGDTPTSAWYVSSDRMGTPKPNGSTLHADWFGAWDDEIEERWVQSCLRERRSVSWGNLCDGQALRISGEFARYTGPRYLTGWTPTPHAHR